MEAQKAADYVQTDPQLGVDEKEFTVGFTKDEDRARLQTNISSQIKRALNHSDIEAREITVFNKDEKTYRAIELEDFEGDGAIVGFRGFVPIESIKINSKPRSHRSFAAIISPQNGVDFE